MKQSFLYNIALLIGLNLLIKPLYIFGIDAQVQNILGEEIYGTYFGLFSLCFLFQVIIDPGLQNYNVTTVSKDRTLIRSQFWKIIYSKLLLACLFALVLFSFAWLLGYSEEQLLLLTKILCLQITVSFAIFIRTNLSALGEYRKDSLLSVLDKLILIICVGYLIYISRDLSNFTIHTWIKAQIFAAGVTILTSAFLLRKYFSIVAFKEVISGIPALIKASAPYALVFLLMTLYTKMDAVMLERLISDNGKEAGIYAAGFRLFEAGNMFAFLFASLLLPMFSASLTDKEKLYRLSQSALRILLPCAVVVVLASLFYGQEIMELIYTEGNVYYGQVFSVLMLGFFSVCISYIYGTLITATEKLKWFNICFLIGIALNWSLNLYLIPRHQALGAAYATAITQGFIITSQLFLAHNQTGIHINSGLILRTIVFIALSVIVFHYLAEFGNMMTWYVIMALSVIFSLIISFLVGLFRFDFASLLIKSN